MKKSLHSKIANMKCTKEHLEKFTSEDIKPYLVSPNINHSKLCKLSYLTGHYDAIIDILSRLDTFNVKSYLKVQSKIKNFSADEDKIIAMYDFVNTDKMKRVNHEEKYKLAYKMGYRDARSACAEIIDKNSNEIKY